MTVAPSPRYQLVRYEPRGQVVRITIDRPESRNALNAQCHSELTSAFHDYARDNTLRVAILTGAGDKAFCAGSDMKEYLAAPDEAPAAERPLPIPPISKPIIAAVNGWAVGGGFELALACDIIIASDTASFGLPEVRRGLVAGGGGLIWLPRQIPTKAAMGMILTGNPITAAEALALGLVNEVVGPADLGQTADRWAADVAACSPVSLQFSKRIIQLTLALPESQALEVQAEWVARSMASGDAQEGMRAFTEKRAPQWPGY